MKKRTIVILIIVILVAGALATSGRKSPTGQGGDATRESTQIPLTDLPTLTLTLAATTTSSSTPTIQLTSTTTPTLTETPSRTPTQTRTPRPTLRPTLKPTLVLPTATTAPIVIVPTDTPASSYPAGATAICKDGTYSYSQHRSGTCSHHGGVLRWLVNLP